MKLQETERDRRIRTAQIGIPSEVRRIPPQSCVQFANNNSVFLYVLSRPAASACFNCKPGTSPGIRREIARAHGSLSSIDAIAAPKARCAVRTVAAKCHPKFTPNRPTPNPCTTGLARNPTPTAENDFAERRSEIHLLIFLFCEIVKACCLQP